MAISELLWIVLLGTVSGLMIGCIGIGGVILVPALVFLADIPIRIAIPAVMLSYIVSGSVATIVFGRNKSIHWPMAMWLCLGATPAAFAGAWAVSVFNPRLLEACLGLLTFLSGLNSFRLPQTSELHASAVSSKVLLPVGAGTGLLSSLTGTGGPLVLVPILIAMNVPVLTAVGLSQVIQLPVALAATLGNILYGTLDLTLGGLLAVSLAAGSWYGAKLAHIVPRSTLRRIVSVVLVLTGTFILAKVGWRMME